MRDDTSSPDALVWDVAQQLTNEIGKWYNDGQPKGETKMTEEKKASTCRHYSGNGERFCSLCCRDSELERTSHLPCCVQPENHGPETPCDTVSTKYADESRDDLARRVTVLEKYRDQDFEEKEELLSEVKRWHVAGMYREQSQSNCVDNECKNFGAPTLFLCDECVWPDAKMRMNAEAIANLNGKVKFLSSSMDAADRKIAELVAERDRLLVRVNDFERRMRSSQERFKSGIIPVACPDCHSMMDFVGRRIVEMEGDVATAKRDVIEANGARDRALSEALQLQQDLAAKASSITWLEKDLAYHKIVAAGTHENCRRENEKAWTETYRLRQELGTGNLLRDRLETVSLERAEEIEKLKKDLWQQEDERRVEMLGFHASLEMERGVCTKETERREAAESEVAKLTERFSNDRRLYIDAEQRNGQQATQIRLLEEELRKTKEACRESIEIEKGAVKGAGDREEAYYKEHRAQLERVRKDLAEEQGRRVNAEADRAAANALAEFWRNRCRETVAFGLGNGVVVPNESAHERLRAQLDAQEELSNEERPERVCMYCGTREGVAGCIGGMKCNPCRDERLREAGYAVTAVTEKPLERHFNCLRCGALLPMSVLVDGHCSGCMIVRAGQYGLGQVTQWRVAGVETGPVCVHMKPIGYCTTCQNVPQANRFSLGQTQMNHTSSLESQRLQGQNEEASGFQNGWTGKAVL